jgi:hypothetical protein
VSAVPDEERESKSANDDEGVAPKHTSVSTEEDETPPLDEPTEDDVSDPADDPQSPDDDAPIMENVASEESEATTEATPSAHASIPPAPIPHVPEHVARASRAFALAAKALDPNDPERPDPALARLLFAEAATSAVRALLSKPNVDLASGLKELDERGALSRILGRKNQAVTLTRRLDADEPITVTEARDLEPQIAKLVQATRGKRSLLWGERLRLAGLALFLLGIALAAALYLARQPEWMRYRYKASSAQAGYTIEGTLRTAGMSGLIFHTQDQAAPWVEIDLGKTQKISRVALKQREDCCLERGIPLTIEVAGNDRVWTVVAKRNQKFDVWEARFKPRKARYVRLSSTAKTILHYTEVKIQ